MIKLMFYGLVDFYQNKEQIKREYYKMPLNDKIIFKKEVYSLCFEKEYIKDLIWEYLNDWKESECFLIHEYMKKKRIIDNRQKKYDSEKNTEQGLF